METPYNMYYLRDKTENGNEEWVKATITRPKCRKQHQAINWSSAQRKSPTHGGGRHTDLRL